MLIRHILIKVFQPGNKKARTLRVQAPPRKSFTQQGIDAALKQVADQIERLHPLEDYRMQEIAGGRQFNFVHIGTRGPEAL